MISILTEIIVIIISDIIVQPHHDLNTPQDKRSISDSDWDLSTQL